MPEFWIDSDALITAKNGHLAFEVAPGFWDCLLELAASARIQCPLLVQIELTDGKDKLADWAKSSAASLFCEPSEDVQLKYNEIANYPRGYYAEAHAKEFLRGADAWHIAHAVCEGGRIVTAERESRSLPTPRDSKARIPDVAKVFGVECLRMNDMLIAAGVKISFSIA